MVPVSSLCVRCLHAARCDQKKEEEEEHHKPKVVQFDSQVSVELVTPAH